MKDALIEIYGRDILKIKNEITAYKDESSLWITGGNINNSAGNLCLHLIGNLNHFIGAVLGKNGYIRKRDDEFELRNIPLKVLIDEIEKVRDLVLKTLASMEEKDFTLDFPEKKHDKMLRTDFMLFHLLAHLNYHIGQINYHRRLLEQ